MFALFLALMATFHVDHVTVVAEPGDCASKFYWQVEACQTIPYEKWLEQYKTLNQVEDFRRQRPGYWLLPVLIRVDQSGDVDDIRDLPAIEILPIDHRESDKLAVESESKANEIALAEAQEALAKKDEAIRLLEQKLTEATAVAVRNTPTLAQESEGSIIPVAEQEFRIPNFALAIPADEVGLQQELFFRSSRSEDIQRLRAEVVILGGENEALKRDLEQSREEIARLSLRADTEKVAQQQLPLIAKSSPPVSRDRKQVSLLYWVGANKKISIGIGALLALVIVAGVVLLVYVGFQFSKMEKECSAHRAKEEAWEKRKNELLLTISRLERGGWAKDPQMLAEDGFVLGKPVSV